MAPLNSDEIIHIYNMVPLYQFRERTSVHPTGCSLIAEVSVM